MGSQELVKELVKKLREYKQVFANSFLIAITTDGYLGLALYNDAEKVVYVIKIDPEGAKEMKRITDEYLRMHGVANKSNLYLI